MPPGSRATPSTATTGPRCAARWRRPRPPGTAISAISARRRTCWMSWKRSSPPMPRTAVAAPATTCTTRPRRRCTARRPAASPIGPTSRAAPTCCSTKACTAAVKTDRVDIARHADLKVGVVPVINLEWIQKIHRDKSVRGYSTEAVMDTILRRMPDYVRIICPQFARNGHEFPARADRRYLEPLHCALDPDTDESMVVIRFRNPRGIDFAYLTAMLQDSFMSRANSIVIPGSKLDLAMQLIMTPWCCSSSTAAGGRAEPTFREPDPWPSSPCVNCWITPPSTATACRRSTSTTWSRCWRSWRRRRRPTRRSSSRPAAAPAPTPATSMLKHLIEAAGASCIRTSRSAMHQDHGNSAGHLRHGDPDGFTSVMMDGSLQATTARRRPTTTTTSRSPATSSTWPTAVGVSVEGELGVPGLARDRQGREGGRPRRRGQARPRPAADRSRTRPASSSKATEVDALAVAMGTSHGAYKFTRKPDGDVLAMNVIEEIHQPPAQHPPGDARLAPRCRRTCRTSSTNTAARCRRPGACRWKRSSAASSTACARSTSTPTTAWP